MVFGEVLAGPIATADNPSTWFDFDEAVVADEQTVLFVVTHRTSAQAGLFTPTLDSNDFTLVDHTEDIDLDGSGDPIVDDSSARRAVFVFARHTVAADEATSNPTINPDIGTTVAGGIAYLIDGVIPLDSIVVALDSSGTGKATSLSPDITTGLSSGEFVIGGAVQRHKGTASGPWTNLGDDFVAQDGSSGQNGLTASAAVGLASGASFSDTVTFPQSDECTAFLVGFTSASGTDATVSPPVAGANATLETPTVTAEQIVTVSPPVADADATFPVPTVTSAVNTTVSPPVANANATAPVPVISAASNATVASPVANANSTLEVPTVTATSSDSSNPPVANANATLEVPTVTATTGTSISVPVSNANATFEVPIPGSDINRTIVQSTPTLTAEFPVPFIGQSQNATVNVPVANADATAPIPTVSQTSNATVTVPLIDGTATFLAPGISSPQNKTISQTTPTLTATAPTPTITAGTNGGPDSVPVINASATLLVPTVISTSNANITAPLISGTATLLVPDIDTKRDADISAPTINSSAIFYQPRINFFSTELLILSQTVADLIHSKLLPGTSLDVGAGHEPSINDLLNEFWFNEGFSQSSSLEDVSPPTGKELLDWLQGEGASGEAMQDVWYNYWVNY